MNESTRNNYLAAMQIDRWLPRVVLPYAAPSASTIPSVEPPVTAAILPTDEEKSSSQVTIVMDAEVNTQPPIATTVPSLIPEATNDTETPHFALQLMQAGDCLLLIELSKKQTLQIADPSYQLLRNILKAAQLPDSPVLLSDIIHWPLFKQANIPQGAKEAQEFLQSYLTTFLEQLPNTKCLWLIGLAAIRYAAGFDEQVLGQSANISPLGQILLVPSLESLLEQPSLKATLWQSIKQLIPLWQTQLN